MNTEAADRSFCVCLQAGQTPYGAGAAAIGCCCQLLIDLGAEVERTTRQRTVAQVGGGGGRAGAVGRGGGRRGRAEVKRTTRQRIVAKVGEVGGH